MTSVLIVTDRGLDVRRFAHVNHARVAQALIESDGLPAVLVARVCAWCRKDLGAVVGSPGQEGMVSHGMCPACSARLLAELPGVPPVAHTLVRGERLESEGAKVVRCGSLSADAGSPAPSSSRVAGANDAAAVPAQTPPGAEPSQVTGTTAPGAYEPAALGHLSGGPVASSDLKMLEPQRPARGVIEFLDWLLKWAVTGRRIDE